MKSTNQSKTEATPHIEDNLARRTERYAKSMTEKDGEKSQAQAGQEEVTQQTFSRKRLISLYFTIAYVHESQLST